MIMVTMTEINMFNLKLMTWSERHPLVIFGLDGHAFDDDELLLMKVTALMMKMMMMTMAEI